MSRRTGKFKVVENGIKYIEKESEEIIEWMKNVSVKVKSSLGESLEKEVL